METRKSERALSRYVWPKLMPFHKQVAVATVGWSNVGSLGWQRNCSNASKQQKLTSHCLAQLTACATQLGRENACSCPSSSPLKHHTELWNKMLNWSNFHCASSDIQQWGSCRGSPAVPHTNVCSSDNVCIVCPLHCGAPWLWGTTFASLPATLADTTDLLEILHQHFFCVH